MLETHKYMLNITFCAFYLTTSVNDKTLKPETTFFKSYSCHINPAHIFSSVRMSFNYLLTCCEVGADKNEDLKCQKHGVACTLHRSCHTIHTNMI